MLRERGEDPVAVSCDAIQVYRGLEVLSGAPDQSERAALEHRLVGIVDVDEEFSAGRFAELARTEIDGLIEAGRRPIVVGGTGLYMRAALADLDLQPPVPAAVRDLVEAQIAELGPAALHAELDPDLGEGIHPNDRKRVARALELQRAGLGPVKRGTGLWTARLRHPTALLGIVVDREQLADRIDRRVDEMAAAGGGRGGPCRPGGGSLADGRIGAGFRRSPDRGRRRRQGRPSPLCAAADDLAAEDGGRRRDRPHRTRRPRSGRGGAGSHRPPSAASCSRSSMTWSINPYSLASSALKNRSRSMSSWIVSMSCPV